MDERSTAPGPTCPGSRAAHFVFGFGLAPVLLDTPNHYPWQRPE
jgi:hypothetical protein